MPSDGRQVPEGQRRPWLRAALLGGVALLYALSIPWYRPAGAEPAVWWGLPDWFVVALGCYAGAALLNALAWLATDVSDPPREDGEGRG